MSTNIVGSEFHERAADKSVDRVESELMRWLPLVGRIFYSALFVMTAFGHFSAKTIGYAASQGVPMAGFLVPLSGIMATAGGLSILLGYHARIGAWLVVLFLVPVTIAMHAFWSVPDPQMAMMHQAMFMKNVALLGSALLIAYFGAGPISLDARRR